MSKIHFKIKTRKSKQYFDVFVYENRKDLEKAATEYDLKAGKKKVNHLGVLGICHPFERFRIDGKQEIHHNQIGILRLTTKAGIGVASHEVLHAAFWYFRLQHQKADFGKECSLKEEAFGHIFTELIIDLTNKMYKKGIWK